MRDDRLLLDYFSSTNTNPIAHQEKWWWRAPSSLLPDSLPWRRRHLLPVSPSAGVSAGACPILQSDRARLFDNL
jgi:hypothetical protein